MQPATLQPALPQTIQGDQWDILPEIYRPDVNMVIVRQVLPPSPERDSAIQALLHSPRLPALRFTGSVEQCRQAVHSELPAVNGLEALADAISLIADAFSTLFDLQQVGLRLERLEQAMCPRFHVDRVPVRLLLTLAGAGTEWLPENACQRQRRAGGVCTDDQAIQQLQAGDIALLKGEEWEGNEGRGLVHRSPALAEGERRLMLTMDFA